MNRRSFVVAGALLTAGCTGGTPEETSPTPTDDVGVPDTTSPKPATATVTTSLETAEVGSESDFELTIYPPDDYTVEIGASRGRSATVDVNESSFTCESAITIVYVSESMPMDSFEREPDASCDAPGGGSPRDVARNETSTSATTTSGAEPTTPSTATTADQ
jgi:hypothetical protein